MKANEIQISDWLYSIIDRIDHTEKKLCKVTGIRTDSDVPLIQCDDTDVWYSLDSYEPIPLTPEILEKNGVHLYNRKTNDFREECNHCDCFDEDEEWRLELSLDYNGRIRWSINGDEYTIIPLDYVHQLQQALRLCGIEKEIIL